MGTDIAVCIPWRPQPQRLAAFEYVTNWWESNGFRVVTGDSDRPTFNLSAARNEAVREAQADIVIVADADTVPELGAIKAALRQLQRYMVIYPFNSYRYLEDVEPTPDLVLGSQPGAKEWRNSVGGLFVTMTETYWSVGGHDEGFERWGYEDNAFHMAAETLGRVVRLAGTVYAFGHEAERDMSKKNPGRARVELYRYARLKPDVMRELIKR